MEQREPEKRKHGKRYVLAGGVLVMLLVCFLLGVIVGQGDGEPETALVSASPGPTGTAIPSETAEPIETATPTETAEPTMTPEPTRTATPRPTFTATPEPTETPEPTPTATLRPMPTATPVPVATAVPTATALPTLTRAGWARQTEPHLGILIDALETISALAGSPLFGNDTWTALVVAQVVKIREADAALREVVPPEEYREVHEMLLSATGDYVLAGEYTQQGVEQQDPHLLEQATEYMKSGQFKLDLCRLMLEAIIS